MRLNRLFVAITLGSALASLGCSSDPSATASDLAANSSTSLNGTVGVAVSAPPSVKVTSSKGGGFSGASVTFTASNGSSATEATVTTDEEGIATVGSWVLGHTTGSYTLTATVGTLTAVTFTATAAAGPPANLTIVSGNSQTAGVGAAVAAPLVVAVKDQFNNLVATGTAVNFQVATGGGTIAAGSVTTDAQGQAAKTGWTLGTVSGAQTVNATAGSAPAALFTATATPGAPASLAIGTGDAQTGNLGAPLAAPLTAKVSDQFGNGVPGASVNFALTAGGGTFGSPNATTNTQGIASTTFTITSPGISAISASSSAFTPVAFSVNTGPTIVGTITVGATASGPAGNASRAQTSGLLKFPGLNGSQPAAHTLKGTALPATMKGKLVVKFRRDAVGLGGVSANAYRAGNAVMQQAVQAYSSVLEPHVRSGRVVQRAISAPGAAARVDVPAGVSEEEVIAALQADPRVEWVAEDGIASTTVVGSAPASDIGMLAASWMRGSARAGAPGNETYSADPMLYQQLWHYRMVDAFRAWKVTTGSASVRIGIIDTGIRADHPALAGMVTTTQGFDFLDGLTTNFFFPNTSTPWAQPICPEDGGGTFLNYRGPAPYNAVARNLGQDAMQYSVRSDQVCWTRSTSGSHGTHVAGTIASAANDAIGGTGVNWAATIIPIKALGVTGSGSYFDISQAMYYAGGLCATYVGAPGGTCIQMPAVQVVNMSLGGSCAGSTVQLIADAAAAIAGTTLIVASAGNDNTSTPSCPASFPTVLAVSALGPTYNKAAYSNTGSHIQLAAPGGDLNLSSTSGVLSSTWNFATGAGNYAYYHGTSMAAPHVTAIAALIKAANPSFTAAQIKDRLINGAVDRGTAGRDNIFGYGIVNAYNSVTGTTGPVTTTVVRAVNAAGTVVRTTTPAGDGSFAFTNLPAGDYLVVAGQDEAGDGVFGLPGRRFGGVTAVQSVSGVTVKTASFSLGSMGEAEPNGTNPTATPLVVNSWVTGSVGGGDAIDLYSITIPAAGTYTMETSGKNGACGVSLDAKTALRLLSASGTVVTSNGNVSFPVASYPGDQCSLMSTALTPGQYFIEVSAPVTSGTYRLHVRSGN